MANYLRSLPARFDNWTNLLSGLGVRNRDAAVSTVYVERPPLGYGEQRWLYRQDWACGRVVDDLAYDATRAGCTLTTKEQTDAAELVMQDWDDAQVMTVMEAGLRWALVYGGAVGVVMTDDKATTLDPSMALSTPLIPGTYTRITRVQIIERTYAVPNMGQIDLDPASPNYGLPLYYDCTPQLGAGTTTWSVHWTRIIRFLGVPVDSLTAVANLSYGDSLFERPFNAVRDHGAGVASTAGIIQKFTQAVMKIPGLMSDLVSDQESRVLSRLRAFNLGLGTSGLGIIDGENEDFTMMGQPVNGLQGLLVELRTELAGSLNYPQSRLYGTAAGALASSETDERRWASVVHAWAISRVVPALTRYTEIMLGARGAVDLQDWRVKPNPIAAPDAKRDAEVRKINAETDVLYVQGGVLEPVEIRDSRFGGAEYGESITLDPAISASVASNQAAAMATEVQTPAGPAEPTPAPDATAGAADFGGVA